MPADPSPSAAMSVDDAIRAARAAMDEASPDGAQLPRGQDGQALVDHVTMLRLACDNAPEFSMCISEPLFMLYPYEVVDALGLDKRA